MQDNQVWHAVGNSGGDLLKLCLFVIKVVSFSCDICTHIVTSAILFFTGQHFLNVRCSC